MRRILWRARSLASIARTTINGPGWIVDRLSFLILRLILFLPFRRTTSQWRRNCASFSRGQVNEVKTIRRLSLSLSAGGGGEEWVLYCRFARRIFLTPMKLSMDHFKIFYGIRTFDISIDRMKNWDEELGKIFIFLFFFLLRVLFKYVIQWKRNCTLLLL